MRKIEDLKKSIVTTTNKLNLLEARSKRRPRIRSNPPAPVLASRARKEIKKLSQELKEELEQEIKQAKIRLEEAKEFEKKCEFTLIMANPPPASQIMEEELNLKKLNEDLKALALKYLKDKTCSTCGEPYTKPPTDRAIYCSNGFHCCRDCDWDNGRRTKLCDFCKNWEKKAKEDFENGEHNQ